MADNSHEPDPDILNTEELAAKIRISPPTIRKAAARGDLPGMRIGKDWRFSYAAVVAAISSYHPVGDEDDEATTAQQVAALDFPYDIREGVPQRNPTRQKPPTPVPKGKKARPVDDDLAALAAETTADPTSPARE